MMKNVLAAIGRYFKQTDIWLILIALSASAFGSVMVYSATHGSRSHFITQTAAILLGIVGMVLISRIDYEDIAEYGNISPLRASYCCSCRISILIASRVLRTCRG
jgi:cell division protein FtsW (lipid II flippase)